MSKTVQISSPAQLSDLLKASRIVVADCKCSLAVESLPPFYPAATRRGCLRTSRLGGYGYGSDSDSMDFRHDCSAFKALSSWSYLDNSQDESASPSPSVVSLLAFPTRLPNSSPQPTNFQSCFTVYADWCGPCKQIAPIYEQLSQGLSRQNVVTFVKVNTDQQKEIAQAYGVTALPTFIVFRDGKVIEKVQGADPRKLQEVVKKLGAEVENVGTGGEASGSGSSGAGWRGADLPRGYTDITSQIEIQRCELLNVASDTGGVRVLFDSAKPSALAGGKANSKDWIESDTDEQLMLFLPFQSMIKLHTLQVGLRAWPIDLQQNR